MCVSWTSHSTKIRILDMYVVFCFSLSCPFGFRGTQMHQSILERGHLLLPWPFRVISLFKKMQHERGGRESTDKVCRGARAGWGREDMGEEVKADVGVMKSEARQLDADSKWDTEFFYSTVTLISRRFSGWTHSKGGSVHRVEDSLTQTVYCMEVHDTSRQLDH